MQIDSLVDIRFTFQNDTILIQNVSDYLFNNGQYIWTIIPRKNAQCIILQYNPDPTYTVMTILDKEFPSNHIEFSKCKTEQYVLFEHNLL